MEITGDIRSRYKAILIETFKQFQKFCEDNKLTYYAAGGTAIGAIRHNGIIPWDDDIDVIMPRPDYDKMLQLVNSLEGTDYEIIKAGDPNYYLFFAKFCNRKTTIWEYEEHPCIFGVFIDIFPLDEVSGVDKSTANNVRIHQQRWLRYRGSLKKHSIRTVTQILKTKDYKAIGRMFIDCCLYRFLSKYLYKKYTEHYRKVITNKGNYRLSYSATYGLNREVFPEEWFNKTILHEFENLMIPLPFEYDKYLRRLYGDYMKLPSVEKRVSRHSVFFLDLDKRLTVEEVKEKINGK